MSYSSFSSSSLPPSSSPANHRDEIAAATFQDAIRVEIRALLTRIIFGRAEMLWARDKVAERRVVVEETDVRPRISSEKPDSKVVPPPPSPKIALNTERRASIDTARQGAISSFCAEMAAMREEMMPALHDAIRLGFMEGSAKGAGFEKKITVSDDEGVRPHSLERGITEPKPTVGKTAAREIGNPRTEKLQDKSRPEVSATCQRIKPSKVVSLADNGESSKPQPRFAAVRRREQANYRADQVFATREWRPPWNTYGGKFFSPNSLKFVLPFPQSPEFLRKRSTMALSAFSWAEEQGGGFSMLFVAILASASEWKGVQAFVPLRVLGEEYEGQKQQKLHLETKHSDLLQRVAQFETRIEDFLNQFDNVQSHADPEAASMLDQLEYLQQETNGKISVFEHNWQSFAAVVLEEVEKLTNRIRLFVAPRFSVSTNSDVAVHLASSVDIATQAIESLHLKLEAPYLDPEGIRNSYEALDQNLTSMDRRIEEAFSLIDTIYRSLRELILNSLEEVEGYGIDLRTEELFGFQSHKLAMLIQDLQKLVDERQHLLHSRNELMSELMSRIKDIDEVKKKCFNLAVTLEENEQKNSHLEGMMKWAEDIEAAIPMDDRVIEVAKQPLLRLEAVVVCLLPKHTDAIEQVKLSQAYPLSTEPNCGDPAYSSFSCNSTAGQLRFNALDGSSHAITSINAELRTFVIQPEDMHICWPNGAKSKDVLLNSRLPFYLTNRSSVLLFDCAAPQHSVTLNCPTSTLCEQYIYDGPAACINSSMCCSQLAGGLSAPKSYSIGVLHTGCSAYANIVNANLSSPASTWQVAVAIGWEPPLAPVCNSSTDCRAWANSTCLFDGGQRWTKRCIYNSNLKWNPLTLNCTKDNIRHKGLEASSHSWRPLALIIPIAIVPVFLFAGVLTFCLGRTVVRKTEATHKRSRMSSSPLGGKDIIGANGTAELDIPFFDFGSVAAATGGFSESNKLGQGGFGPVYQGKLPGGQEIAVKRLSQSSGQGLEDFKNEVMLIAKLQHRHLVRLLGYCIAGDEKMIIYEYLPNKSLDLFLFEQNRCRLLDWKLRFNIILGIARGLLYLHHDLRLGLIHRDLKRGNVLLGEEVNPKISDFGMPRMFGGHPLAANTNRVVGTFGYMSPEYAVQGRFSVNSDVYSFGIIVLELVSGKKNTAFCDSQESLTLLGHAWRLWNDDRGLDLIHPSLSETCPATEVLRCIRIGLLCVQADAADRPNIFCYHQASGRGTISQNGSTSGMHRILLLAAS